MQHNDKTKKIIQTRKGYFESIIAVKTGERLVILTLQDGKPQTPSEHHNQLS